MRVGILSWYAPGTELILQNLTQKHPEKQGVITAVQGKLHGHELVVADVSTGEIEKALYILTTELGVEKIIGLGQGDQISPSLRPGDMIISGEVWEEGGNNSPFVYPADPKLVDLFLAAAERVVDEGEELRALVGRLVDAVNTVQEENQSTTVYYTDSLATRMAKWSSCNSIPFVILHVIITYGEIEDDEFHRNGAKRLFWLLKGVLEELKNPQKEI